MEPENNLPQVFYDMLDRVNISDKLNQDIITEYCTHIQGDETFLPDLLSIVGPEAFESMVRYHGGQYFYVPRADEVLTKVSQNE
jgi:hypothetical protein